MRVLLRLLPYADRPEEDYMNWTEVNIYTTTQGIDPVCGRLLNIGITSGFAIKDANDFDEFLNNKTGNWDYIDDDLMNLKSCETCVTVYLPENSQGAENLIALRGEMELLRALDTDNSFGRLAVELADIREEDWANNWKQYFKPIKVGEKILIKPSWETVDNTDNRRILEIDPASSFGTGQHHTTRLCLELLEKHMTANGKMLDLGCGSGILSIGGILLGARSAFAVDIDENSVKIAKENAEKNNISPDIMTAVCGNIINDESLRSRIGTGYDVITANIVADVIIAMSGYFGGFLADNGTLILSGIITERKQEVIDAVSKKGFEPITVFEKGGWAAVSLKKSGSRNN